MGLREDFEMPPGHELFLDHKVELSHRGVEETVRVEQHDWFIVQAEFFVRDRLEKLIHGSSAARQDDNGVGNPDHHLLPLRHVIGMPHIRHPFMLPLDLDHEAGNDTRHLTSTIKDGVSDSPHQTGAATPIDKPPPLIDKTFAKPSGLINIILRDKLT